MLVEPLPQTLSASVNSGVEELLSGPLYVAFPPRVPSTIVYCPPDSVVCRDTVPSTTPVPEPVSSRTEAQWSRTLPLRAPTKTNSPAGEPSELRPVTSTRHASVGARCTARTTRSWVACVLAKSTTEAAFAVAVLALTEAVVGSWNGVIVRPETERNEPPWPWWTTKSPPTTSRPR